MPKYSFIIPVFQVEQYLDECVDSILKQTYQDYEIILVDDGSWDRSGVMCDEYARKNDCVRVIHQKNAGLSAARNTGVRYASGEYIIFLDSDDYWADTEGLEKIERLTQQGADVVVFASNNLFSDSGRIVPDRYDYPKELNNMKPWQCLQYMVQHDMLNVHAAKKVIRKNFFIENGLFFQEGIRSEDIEWGIRLANCLPQYRFLNEKLYVYRHRSGSISRTIGEKHLEDYLGIIRKYVHFEYRNEEIRNCLLSYVAYQYTLLLANITFRKPSKAKEMLRELKGYRHLFRHTDYPRTRMISFAYRFIGFWGVRHLMAYALKRRMHN